MHCRQKDDLSSIHRKSPNYVCMREKPQDGSIVKYNCANAAEGYIISHNTLQEEAGKKRPAERQTKISL